MSPQASAGRGVMGAHRSQRLTEKPRHTPPKYQQHVMQLCMLSKLIDRSNSDWEAGWKDKKKLLIGSMSVICMILVIENFVFLVETFLFVEFLEGFCLVVQTESISAHTTISSSSLFVFQRALFQEKQSRCSRFHEWGWRFCFPSICDTKK